MEILKIFLYVLGSEAVLKFIEFLVTRKDRKKGRLDKIEARLDGIEKRQKTEERDICRSQMMMLMKLFPDDMPELLKVG